MRSDATRLEANVDYGNLVGYFVRIDVELPRDARYSARADETTVDGWLGLSPAEAEAFAADLVDSAQRARAANAELPGAVPDTAAPPDPDPG